MKNTFEKIEDINSPSFQGRREKYSIITSDIEECIELARNKFESGNFLESFDIYEQLALAFPAYSIEILAQLYDLYQRLPSKDRYSLYQARLIDFDIKPTDKVLDVGSGHIPFPLATHLTDITLTDHHVGRAGVPFKSIQGIPVYECSVENMPFNNQEFDFIYCSHVLEHVDNPEKACEELMRVGKRGYIETPSKGKDIFLNSAKTSNHKWWIEIINDTLVFTEYRPEEIDALQSDLLMDMHCAPQTRREKAFSSLIYLKADRVNTMFLWEGRFGYEVRRLVNEKGREHRSGKLYNENYTPVTNTRRAPACDTKQGQANSNESSSLISDIQILLDKTDIDYQSILNLSQRLYKEGYINEYSELQNFLNQNATIPDKESNPGKYPEDAGRQAGAKSSIKATGSHVLKFLQVNTFYPNYLAGFYQTHQTLMDSSFNTQMSALVRDGFSAIHIFAPYMNELDYEASLIIANNPYSQRQWIIENKQAIDNLNNWINDVTRKQIETIRPDVLYLTDPLAFDSDFIRSLNFRPRLVIGWRAANIKDYIDWSEFDVMLSALSGVRDIALKLGAKAVEYFFPGFPVHISKTISDVTPVYDLVFSGQWTLAQHPRRNRYLTEIANEASRPNSGFSCAFYLSGQVDTIPPEVAQYDRGGHFGIDMYRALRSGRIAFDARGVIETKDPITGQMIDLADKETANMRIFEATGCGVFLLTEYYENLNRYFEIGTEIETFTDRDELIDKIRYYTNNHEKREQIARKGHLRCIQEYSMNKRAIELNGIIKKYLS